MTKNIFLEGKKNLDKKKSRQFFLSKKKNQHFSDSEIFSKFWKFSTFFRFWDFEIFFHIFKISRIFLKIFFKKLFDFQNFHFSWDFSIFHYFTIFNTNSLKITENTQKIELNRFRVLRTPLDNYLRSYERLKTTHIPKFHS